MIVFQYISLILSGILVENIFFTRALDAGNMIDLVNEPRKILDFSVTFTVATTVSSILCAIVDKFTTNLEYVVYIRPTIYLLVISLVYVIIYYILRNNSKANLDKYKNLLSYACINSGVYGVLFVNQRYEHNILESGFYGVSAGLGMFLALLIILSAKKKLAYSNVPKIMKGLPILLIYIGLLSLGIFGLFGHPLPA